MNTDYSTIHAPNTTNTEIAIENINKHKIPFDLSRVPRQLLGKYLAIMIQKKQEKIKESKKVVLTQKEIDDLVQKRANEITAKKNDINYIIGKQKTNVRYVKNFTKTKIMNVNNPNLGNPNLGDLICDNIRRNIQRKHNTSTTFNLIESRRPDPVIPFWETRADFFEDLPEETKDFFLRKRPLNFGPVEEMNNTDNEEQFNTEPTENEIVLINFDNDTFTPISKMDDDSINILKNLHASCGICIDVEETNVKYPIVFEENNPLDFLYKNMTSDLKESYLNDYISNKINYLKNSENYSKFETNNKLSIGMSVLCDKLLDLSQSQTGDENLISLIKEFKTNSKQIESELVSNIKNIRDNYEIEEYGIVIPENLKIKREIKQKEPEINEKKQPIAVSKNYIGLGNFSEYSQNVSNQYTDVPISSYGTVNTFIDDNFPSMYLINGSKKSVVEPYNYFYDCLNPVFSTNCEFINSTPITEESKSSIPNIRPDPLTKLDPIFTPNKKGIRIKNIKKQMDIVKKKMAVLYNIICSQTIVVEISDDKISKLLENIRGTGFIKLFLIEIEMDNTTLINFIKSELDGKIFDDISSLNNNLTVVSEFINFNSEQRSKNIVKTDDEYANVKIILDACFIIDDDVNHKMKASQLCDLILYCGTTFDLLKIEPEKLSGFKNRLSKYLTDNGLKKKRYNDGYYYYGITKNVSNFPREEEMYYHYPAPEINYDIGLFTGQYLVNAAYKPPAPAPIMTEGKGILIQDDNNNNSGKPLFYSNCSEKKINCLDIRRDPNDKESDLEEYNELE